MAVFSVNQATQMYVGAAKLQLHGGVDSYYVINGEKTDIIKAGHVLRETTTTVGAMNVEAPVATLTVGTVTKAGNDYLVRLTITEDAGTANAYIKSIAVRAASTTNTELATEIRNALTKAAARDKEKLYTVGGADAVVTITPELIHTTGKRFIVPHIKVEVANISTKADVDSDGDTIKIMDPKDGWVKYASAPVPNSGLAKLKDLEYFCAGEKGDVYRGTAYPNDFSFESKIDSSVTDSTDVTTIHYYDDCSNEGVQKSEKTIIIVGTITDTLDTDEQKYPIYDVE